MTRHWVTRYDPEYASPYEVECDCPLDKNHGWPPLEDALKHDTEAHIRVGGFGVNAAPDCPRCQSGNP